MPAAPREVSQGLWRWTARHPEWHGSGWSAEVASFALDAGEDLLLVDPLLPDSDPGPVLERLDGLADGRAVHVLVTVGYHVRSSEALCERFGARLWGPPRCASRLRKRSLLEVLEPGAEGPAGVEAFAIGRPVRDERPLWLPSHRALAFGDAIVTTPDGELRLWADKRVDARVRAFYRDRFAPTLAPLLELPVRRVLVTHGRPVLRGGAKALRAAADAPPWYQRG